MQLAKWKGEVLCERDDNLLAIEVNLIILTLRWVFEKNWDDSSKQRGHCKSLSQNDKVALIPKLLRD